MQQRLGGSQLLWIFMVSPSHRLCSLLWFAITSKTSAWFFSLLAHLGVAYWAFCCPLSLGTRRDNSDICARILKIAGLVMWFVYSCFFSVLSSLSVAFWRGSQIYTMAISQHNPGSSWSVWWLSSSISGDPFRKHSTSKISVVQCFECTRNRCSRQVLTRFSESKSEFLVGSGRGSV